MAEASTITESMTRLASLITRAPGWSPDERRAVLRRLDHAVDGLGAVRAAVLVAERESGAWRGAGDRSFESWRGRTSRVGQRVAAAQVRQAEHLGAVPAIATAVADGRVTLDQATTVAKVAATGTPAQQAAVRSPAAQAALVDLAGRVDGATFATSVARWAAALEPAALERDHEAQRRERFLHVADSSRGTLIKGRLDSMAGHRLMLALEALTPRPAADDDRDRGQRAADALDAMAGSILALADTKPGGHVPPQISMILTEQTWLAARAERDRRRAAVHAPSSHLSAAGAPAPLTDVRAATGAPVDDLGYAPATLEDGSPVPASELAVAMCDCEITRIVLDAHSVPLDLGRTERVFTGAQRRAVIARDRQCAWPDCAMNARWCQIHHIQWWERDAGPTSVDNGVLLCSFHHHEVHRRDLAIERVVRPSVTGSPPPAHPLPARSVVAPTGDVAVAHYVFHERSGRIVGGASPPGPLHGAGDHVPAWLGASARTVVRKGQAEATARPAQHDAGVRVASSAPVASTEPDGTGHDTSATARPVADQTYPGPANVSASHPPARPPTRPSAAGALSRSDGLWATDVPP